VSAPGVETALNPEERGKVLQQHAPMAAAGRQMEDRILHPAQIAWLTQARSAILPAGDISPYHSIPGRFWGNSRKQSSALHTQRLPFYQAQPGDISQDLLRTSV
jgi:hypothetical protein